MAKTIRNIVLVLGAACAASHAGISWGTNVPIKRIVSDVSGAYLYFTHNLVPGAGNSCYYYVANGGNPSGVQLDMAFIPTSDMLATLLVAYQSGAVIKDLAIETADTPRAPTQGNQTPCSVKYVDLE